MLQGTGVGHGACVRSADWSAAARATARRRGLGSRRSGAAVARWTVIDDAKAGEHAVRYQVPVGRPAGPSLNFAALGVVPTVDQELTFWYRFRGQGACSLMVKLVAFPYAAGWQATWGILPKAPVPDGWRRAVIDLSSEWMKWGDKPDEQSRYLQFRTDAAEGAELTLDIDQVVLQPRRFSWSLGPAKVVGEQASVRTTLTNSTAAALTFELSGGGPATQLTVRGGQSAEAIVTAPLDPAGSAPPSRSRSPRWCSRPKSPATRFREGAVRVHRQACPPAGASPSAALQRRTARDPRAREGGRLGQGQLRQDPGQCRELADQTGHAARPRRTMVALVRLQRGRHTADHRFGHRAQVQYVWQSLQWVAL